MKPGDPIIHIPSGRRMTVKAVNGGNAHVLCCWMQRNGAGELVECSAAFKWNELRFPTDEERKNPPAEASPAAGSDKSNEDPGDTSPLQPSDPSPSAEQQPEPMAAAVATSTVEPSSTAPRRKK